MPTAEEMRSLGEEFTAGARERRSEIAGTRAETAVLMARLTGSSAARKAEGAETLAGHRAEMVAARRAWQEHLRPSPPPPVEEVAEQVAAPLSPPVVEAAPPPFVEALPEAKQEVVPDDLTVIRGIGFGTQRRLNEDAEIYTYAQLAKRTPEELRGVLGGAARLARVEEWIEQARELAG